MYPEDIRYEFLDLKKQLQKVLYENSTLKVKVRKLETDNKSKNKQLECLVDPVKRENIRKIITETGTAMLIALKKQNESLEKALKAKENQIHCLHEEMMKPKIKTPLTAPDMLKQDDVPTIENKIPRPQTENGQSEMKCTSTSPNDESYRNHIPVEGIIKLKDPTASHATCDMSVQNSIDYSTEKSIEYQKYIDETRRKHGSEEIMFKHYDNDKSVQSNTTYKALGTKLNETITSLHDKEENAAEMIQNYPPADDKHVIYENKDEEIETNQCGDVKMTQNTMKYNKLLSKEMQSAEKAMKSSTDVSMAHSYGSYLFEKRQHSCQTKQPENNQQNSPTQTNKISKRNSLNQSVEKSSRGSGPYAFEKSNRSCQTPENQNSRQNTPTQTEIITEQNRVIQMVEKLTRHCGRDEVQHIINKGEVSIRATCHRGKEKKSKRKSIKSREEKTVRSSKYEQDTSTKDKLVRNFVTYVNEKSLRKYQQGIEKLISLSQADEKSPSSKQHKKLAQMKNNKSPSGQVNLNSMLGNISQVDDKLKHNYELQVKNPQNDGTEKSKQGGTVNKYPKTTEKKNLESNHINEDQPSSSKESGKNVSCTTQKPNESLNIHQNKPGVETIVQNMETINLKPNLATEFTSNINRIAYYLTENGIPNLQLPFENPNTLMDAAALGKTINIQVVHIHSPNIGNAKYLMLGVPKHVSAPKILNTQTPASQDQQKRKQQQNCEVNIENKVPEVEVKNIVFHRRSSEELKHDETKEGGTNQLFSTGASLSESKIVQVPSLEEITTGKLRKNLDTIKKATAKLDHKSTQSYCNLEEIKTKFGSAGVKSPEDQQNIDRKIYSILTAMESMKSTVGKLVEFQTKSKENISIIQDQINDLLMAEINRAKEKSKKYGKMKRSPKFHSRSKESSSSSSDTSRQSTLSISFDITYPSSGVESTPHPTEIQQSSVPKKTETKNRPTSKSAQLISQQPAVSVKPRPSTAEKNRRMAQCPKHRQPNLSPPYRAPDNSSPNRNYQPPECFHQAPRPQLYPHGELYSGFYSPETFTTNPPKYSNSPYYTPHICPHVLGGPSNIRSTTQPQNFLNRDKKKDVCFHNDDDDVITAQSYLKRHPIY